MLSGYRGEVEVQLFVYMTSTIAGVAVSTTPWPLHLQETDPVLIVTEEGWASELVWVAQNNLAPTSI
jgi:hypothetical protein